MDCSSKRKLKSICLSLSYVCPLPDDMFFAVMAIVSRSSGMKCSRSSAVITGDFASTHICSVIFFSCLTFPGHLYFMSRRLASSASSMRGRW